MAQQSGQSRRVDGSGCADVTGRRAGVAGRVARGVGKVSKGGDELAETGGKLAGDTPTPNTPEPTPKTQPDHGIDANGDPFRPVPETDGFVRPSEMNTPSPAQAEPRPMDARETQAPSNTDMRPEARPHEPPEPQAAHNAPEESTPHHSGDQARPPASTPETPERAGETIGPQPDSEVADAPNRSDSPRDPSDERSGEQPDQRTPAPNNGEPDTTQHRPQPDESDHPDESPEHQTRADDSSPDEEAKDSEEADTNPPEETPADSPPEYDGIPLDSKYDGEHLPGNKVFGTPVTYLDEVERLDYKLHVDQDGMLRDADGDLFDTADASSVHHPEGGRAILSWIKTAMYTPPATRKRDASTIPASSVATQSPPPES